MNFETKSKRNEKVQFFSNIYAERGCGRGHRKYERPFVKKGFHIGGRGGGRRGSFGFPITHIVNGLNPGVSVVCLV